MIEGYSFPPQLSQVTTEVDESKVQLTQLKICVSHAEHAELASSRKKPSEHDVHVV